MRAHSLDEFSANDGRSSVPSLTDDRGALMVIGIFTMPVVVSLLYVLIGTAKTLLAREGMQDAADAGALSAAIFMARGMNLIAMINLLMALLLSVLVALKLTQTFFAISAGALYAFSWFYGITAPAASACHQAADQIGNAYDQLKDPVMQALEVMHEVQEGTSVVVPFVAVGAGMLEAAQHHAPARGAFALPAPQSLPIESDRFELLCGRATQQATTGALHFFTDNLLADVKGVQKVMGIALAPIDGAATAIGEATSGYLCGDGSSKPPKFSYPVEMSYPRHAGLVACEADAESDKCAKMERELDEAAPDEDNHGECKGYADCDYDGPYESMARQARRDCEPRSGHWPKKYTWQRVEVEVRWKYQKGQWVEVDREERRYLEKETLFSPCGPGGSVNAEEYNVDSGPRHRDAPNPVCTTETEELQTPGKYEGEERTVSHTSALRIFSCLVDESESVDLAQEGDAFGDSGSEEKSPHKVQDDVELGDEAFQVRALSFGPEVGAGSALDGVKLSLMGRSPSNTTSTFESMNALNRFAFAQAEFYHSGKHDRGEWLWEMAWKARLKRVRLPSDKEKQHEEERRSASAAETSDKLARFGTDAAAETFEGACSDAGGGCPTDMDLDLFAELVIH